MLLSILNDSVRAAADQQLARLRGLEIPKPPPESPDVITEHAGRIRAAIADAHGTRIRFVISTISDPLGPIKGGPLSYTLDSADPEKLKAIVDDMQRRAHEPIAKLLPATLVIGRNFASEKLAGIYRKFEIDSAPNFISIDEARILPYRLALANKELKPWLEGAQLNEKETAEAFRLAAFLKAQTEQNRDKLTLLLPEAWPHAAWWTRREFDTLNVVIGEKPNLRNYRQAAEPAQDRVFLVVQRKGEQHPEGAAIKALRNAGYPIAALTFNAAAPLSRYMRFIECTAFALRHLRTVQPAQAQPDGRDLRESIEAEILSNGIKENAAWKQLHASPESPQSLAAAIDSAVRSHSVSCGEIALFGDLRYSEDGPAIRKALDNAARLLFRTPFKMPGAVREAPAEISIGHGGCFSILLLSAAQARFALADFEPDRHIAQFLATKLALERKHRPVRAILVKDLSIESIGLLEEFFSWTVKNLSINGQIQSR